MDLGRVIPGARASNTPLYLTDNVLGLGISRVLLGWPMVLLVIAASWWTIRRLRPPITRGSHPRVHREDEVPPPAG